MADQPSKEHSAPPYGRVLYPGGVRTSWPSVSRADDGRQGLTDLQGDAP